MRIKAYKSYCWLNDTTTVYDLTIAAAFIGPMERIMWTFMSWQEKSLHWSPKESPLIQMTSADRSPVVRAVRELCDIMESGRTGPEHPSLQEIAD